jgi:DNA-binding transcriptional MerR regulator
MAKELRLDELAQQAGVASTTVRLYQAKGLLAPPRLEGRTGWYDESHLSRLRLIARLQAEGHSLAGIAHLLKRWEEGHSLDTVVGIEAELDALLGDVHAVVLDPAQLVNHFPAGSLTPELMTRATELGLVQATGDGNLRVADRRFLDTGAALAHLGVPLADVLDEWEELVQHTDQLAHRFIDLFERHLAPQGWQDNLDAAGTRDLATTLTRLQTTARQVTVAALDSSLARTGRERLGQLIPPP